MIVLTRSDRFPDAVRALELRATAYLLKPLEPTRLRAALAVAVEALDPPEDALPPLPAPAAGERVCAFGLPDRAVLHRLADEGLAVTAGADHAAVTIRPGTDDLERVRRSVRPPLGLSAPFDPSHPRPGAPDALAALAAGYFAQDEVRFEDLPAQDEPYPLELERELLRAITVGDTGAALGHLAALSDALTRPVRSPASARHRFRDLVGLIARALPGAASLAWADRWSAEVAAADTAPLAAERLESAWNDAVAQFASAPSSGVSRAQAFVREHLDERLTVAAVAVAAGFHPDHLSHLFRRELGITVGEYVRLCRLEQAKRLLASGTAPVGCGRVRVRVRRPRYFSRAFRRATGMSPTEYRRRLAA